MISERLLSSYLRFEFKRLLNLQPNESFVFPPAKPGKSYQLYIHVPFCESLCPYCSFHRFVCSDDAKRQYFRALHAQMDALVNQGYRFSSLYVGGGTPTILPDELLSVIRKVRKELGVAEVSCETNPNHLQPERMRPFSGEIDRLSVGVQSFYDPLLKQMMRYEKYGSSRQILDSLKGIEGYFPTLNIDLIFNFPSQTAQILQDDLHQAINSAANQITFYPLMTSPSVHNSILQSVGQVEHGREEVFYKMILDGMDGHFVPLSGWTFSRQASDLIDEYIVGGNEYIGLGSGAFSFLDGRLYTSTFSLCEYVKRVTSGLSPIDCSLPFSQHDLMRYYFLMNLFGLRLSKQDFLHTFGMPIERGLWVEMNYLRLAGAFERDDAELLTLTRNGRYLLLSMMRDFFTNIDRLRDQARQILPAQELSCTCVESPA